MRLLDKEKNEINAHLEAIFSILDKKIEEPTKLTESNALDRDLMLLACLYQAILERFGSPKKEDLLKSLKSIMNETVKYYNNKHQDRLGFKIELKNKITAML